jgi:hypothetical protein
MKQLFGKRIIVNKGSRTAPMLPATGDAEADWW